MGVSGCAPIPPVVCLTRTRAVGGVEVVLLSVGRLPADAFAGVTTCWPLGDANGEGAPGPPMSVPIA